jgi:flavodoxin
MKTLVIYYSYEGNCAMIAEHIKAALAADILEVIPENEEKHPGFLGKYFWGGKQLLMNKFPKLRSYVLDTNLYDLIIIGTPVWAGGFPPAMASFFAETKISGKQMALFCCHGGGKGRIFKKMKDALPGNAFLGEMDFCRPLKRKDQSARDKLAKWLRTIAGRD